MVDFLVQMWPWPKSDMCSSWFFLFQDWVSQTATDIATQLCGFVTIVAGTFLLHKTRDMGNPPPRDQICLEEAGECAPRSTNSSSWNLTYADDIVFLYWFKWRFCAVWWLCSYTITWGGVEIGVTAIERMIHDVFLALGHMDEALVFMYHHHRCVWEHQNPTK
jgi:hypothetical protein